jgi:hypothetical protein
MTTVLKETVSIRIIQALQGIMQNGKCIKEDITAKINVTEETIKESGTQEEDIHAEFQNQRVINIQAGNISLSALKLAISLFKIS